LRGFLAIAEFAPLPPPPMSAPPIRVPIFAAAPRATMPSAALRRRQAAAY